ncbi:MAG: molybdate ABC transporter substrate-binding protein [Burkholderiales bacterium]
MKSFFRFALIAIALSPVQSVRADEITLIAPGGIREAIQKMIPEFERKTGHTVKATFGSGDGTKQQVMRGEAFDVPIVQPPLAEVLATGHVIPGSETPLARVPVAVAVIKGAAKPDIATPDAVRKMLLAARVVSYPDGSRGAAAGVSFEETLKKLGIAEQMQSRLMRVQGGANAMVVLAEGKADIGLTFLSEIHNSGVDIVGPLPREISTPTALIGFVSAHARAPEAAKALLSYLSSHEVAGVYKSLGMLPTVK